MTSVPGSNLSVSSAQINRAELPHSQRTYYRTGTIGQLIPEVKAAVWCEGALEYLYRHAIEGQEQDDPDGSIRAERGEKILACPAIPGEDR